MNGETKKIIDNLSVNRPALIVDADEVLLKFVTRLEIFFPTRGFDLRLDSFQLLGNIYELETNLPATASVVKKLISDFFDECVDDIPPVDGAVNHLSALTEYFQIVILSNVPERCRTRRQKSFKKLGMNYPVIANEGGKGVIVKRIADKIKARTVFIDDLPPQHSSVAKHSPETYRIHFIADERLANFLPKATDAHLRLNNWQEIQSSVTEMLER